MARNAHPAIKIRNTLLKQKDWQLMHVFDTNAHAPHKDEVLVKDKEKFKILRVGEHRPQNFFPHGYRGKCIIIPKLFETNEKIPYEVEEYLPGTLLSEMLRAPTARALVPESWLKKLMQGHWELQTVAKNLHLPTTWSRKDNLVKYFRAARPLLGSLAPEINKIVIGKQYRFFWRDKYLCKWKYSADNLIAIPDGRIGLIDNARLGLRYWGYDLGWLVWPRWFYLSNAELKKAHQHWAFLQKFIQLAWRTAPKKEKKNKKLFELKCALIIFERLLGTLYDIQEHIPHAKKYIGAGARKRSFANFLLHLLKQNIQTIQHCT